jgi:hypothetical protein
MSEVSLPGIQQSVSDLMVGLNILGTPAAMPPGGGGGDRWAAASHGRWHEGTAAYAGNVSQGDVASRGGRDENLAGLELARLLSERPGFTELVVGVFALHSEP